MAVPDRRRSHRFPLRLAVKYRTIGSAVVADWTSSESVNISSSGLFFKTPEAVMAGQAVEVLISWPLFLDNHVPLNLVIKGPVVRNGGDGTAMHFETYEFRTCNTAAHRA